VIVELRYGESAKNVDPTTGLHAWDSLGSVPAVRTQRIVILVGDQYVVPGPRIVQAARELGQALHPEARWSR
jgi:ABC-type Fe3+-hydroxamate transport system substrate-binding protein